MNQRRWFGGLLAVGLILTAAGLAGARETTIRTPGQKVFGTRTDITVPFLTTGTSTFMGNYVAPRIYSSPIVDDPANPGSKPVYNLIFYGSVQAFGDKSEGATPRPKR